MSGPVEQLDLVETILTCASYGVEYFRYLQGHPLLRVSRSPTRDFPALPLCDSYDKAKRRFLLAMSESTRPAERLE